MAPDKKGIASEPGSPVRDSPESPRPSHEPAAGEGEDLQLITAERMVGTAMMFIGFLNILLSISGGFEISVFPMILYFAGMAIWAHATIRNPIVRNTVVAASLALGLAFFHYGEVHFWHKQVVFWATVVLVGFFMFTSSKSDR